MSREDEEVVIGSGIGGSAAAALLARQGFEVLLLERIRFPGGKTGSCERDVAPYDGVTVKDFPLSFTEDGELHRLIDVFCGLLFAVPYSESSQ